MESLGCYVYPDGGHGILVSLMEYKKTLTDASGAVLATDYWSYANRRRSVGSGDVTGIIR